MLFTPLLLLFPAISLAMPPMVPRQAKGDNCTFTSILPTITLSSIYPTSTVGHGQVTGGGTLIYTTAYPTLGPDGPGLHTYTVTAPCAETHCQLPASADCPPGFTKTTVVCHACGEQAITTILTLPIESATAGQGSAGGDNPKGGSTGIGSAGNQHVVSSAVTLTAFVTSHRTLVVSVKPTESPESPFPWKSPQGPGLPNNPEHSQVPGDSRHMDTKHSRPAGSRESDYPAIHRNPGSLEPQVVPTSTGTAPQSEAVNGSDSVPTGAGPEAEAGSESASSSYPSGQATSVNPTAIVVTGHAPGGKIARGTLVKVAAFAIFLLYPLYV
ncbi:hypothetical protein HG530_005647 [Fusarium avenaceum]|nr:hypothetical protein DER45DRAFT_608030 [Fusarium avenaceum]KAI6767638.1 hypothetical protein HG530_005647 [Fusarium avenaceum]